MNKRQPDLTICMEKLHKPENIAAVMRTCDAVGVHTVHAVMNENTIIPKKIAMGSERWVNLRTHTTIEEALDYFKTNSIQILSTSLSNNAVDFREVDYTLPTVIVIGSEMFGVSQQTNLAATKCITIPMLGMVQSLNVSVATALILYEAQRQRQNQLMYSKPRLPRDEYQRLLFEIGYPNLARVCKRKRISYPDIEADGKVLSRKEWWRSLNTNGVS